MPPEPVTGQQPLIVHRWRRLRHELCAGYREAAEGGDRWFLAVAHGLDRCTHVVEGSLDALIRGAGAAARRAGWGSRSTRERVERLLLAERRRARVPLDESEYLRFSQRVAALTELVLSGAVPVAGVVFEEGPNSGPISDAPKSP